VKRPVCRLISASDDRSALLMIPDQRSGIEGSLLLKVLCDDCVGTIHPNSSIEFAASEFIGPVHSVLADGGSTTDLELHD
jgi:hypothetical protein